MALPAITSISPGSGPADGGTAVTIHGTGLTGATAVLFGGAQATGVTVLSDQLVNAASPPGDGTVNVTVVTPAGNSASVAASLFAYTATVTTNGGTSVDPGLNTELIGNLLSVLSAAASPDAVEAQNIIMRRIALEGDVTGAGIPSILMSSPTMVGGVLNYLTARNQTAILQQALAGMLGVAGPSQPLGWISNVQPLAMTDVTNDRPAGPAQPAIPLVFPVRSDFVGAVKAAIASVHHYGATVPFASPPVIQLPRATPGATPPADVLKYLGRQLTLAPAAALAVPATDPLAIVRSGGRSAPWQLAARVLTATSATVAPADYDAIQCTPTTKSTVTVTQARLVPLGPALAAAGFYPVSPLPIPANSTETGWATFTNVTGLVAGSTRLGDELSLLYSPETIASSTFASIMDWVWNGAKFGGT
jgi:IPT/TIG domain